MIAGAGLAGASGPGLRRTSPGAFLVAVVMTMAIALPARAVTVSGVDLPDQARIGGETIELRGAGIRTRLFLKLYVAALYGGTSGASGPAIAAADEPMMIRIAIRSNLVTREKMVEALDEGFEKSTGGNTAPVREGIDLALAGLPAELGKGDRIDIVYLPGTGTVMAREGETLATVEGLAFKEALFGIWLSDDPVQADLKAAMLGG